MKRGVDYIGVGVGAIVINRDGKLFLAKRGRKASNESGTWEFPGGAVSYGETLKHALEREVQEEYGFEIEPVELFRVSDHLIPKEKQHWVSPSFLCRIKSGEAKILEPEKCDDIGWFTLSVLDSMPLSIVTQQEVVYLKQKYGSRLPKLY